MTISFEILGKATHDNAVFVHIDSGQKISRLLFDCGEGCLSTLAVSEIQSIDHLLFSHFHMDHISGFDSFFRIVYDRTTRQNVIWGPPGTNKVLHHRFQGFLWNLYQQLSSLWYVHDIYPGQVECNRYAANEAFAVAHFVETNTSTGVIIDTPDYQVNAYQMDHQTPSMAYIVQEKPRTNVDTTRLGMLGLRPGAWLNQIKDRLTDEKAILEIEGKTYTVSALRDELLIESPGQSLGYLTDFLMDENAQAILLPVLQNCTYMICESQYRQNDLELAQRNCHMTATQVAQMALKANVQELILFHISDRYQQNELLELLNEAKSVFPNTRFPDHWFSS